MNGSEKKPHKFEGNVSELLKYCLLGRYIASHAVDSKVKRSLESNSVRSSQPTYEACDDNLIARIEVAPIKFMLCNILIRTIPVSILYKSITGHYRPIRVADEPITARYRFIKNASWDIYYF